MLLFGLNGATTCFWFLFGCGDYVHRWIVNDFIDTGYFLLNWINIGSLLSHIGAGNCRGVVHLADRTAVNKCREIGCGSLYVTVFWPSGLPDGRLLVLNIGRLPNKAIWGCLDVPECVCVFNVTVIVVLKVVNGLALVFG